MPLRDVQLLLEGYDQKHRRAFSVSHVENAIIFFLPKGYDIDGHSKILLNYVKNPTVRDKDYFSLKPNIGSISSIEIDGFVSESFLKLPNEEKENEAARLIRDGLKKVAKRNGASIQLIDEAYEKALKSGFTITWIHKKTSRSRSDRRYRIETYFHQDSNGYLASVAIKRKKDEIADFKLIRSRSLMALTSTFSSVSWENNEVSILNPIDEELFRFRITKNEKVEQVSGHNSDRLRLSPS